MIKIFINDIPKDLSRSFGDVINISELDQILFQFDCEGEPPKVYIAENPVSAFEPPKDGPSTPPPLPAMN